MTKQFNIRQVYLKDVTYQIPMGAAIFTQEWSPEIKVDMNVTHEAILGGLTEVVLTVTVVAKSLKNTAYMIELLQAGIFQFNGYKEDEIEKAVMGKCTAILLPYAREAIDGILMRSRIPALLLDPIDLGSN